MKDYVHARRSWVYLRTRLGLMAFRGYLYEWIGKFLMNFINSRAIMFGMQMYVVDRNSGVV